MQVGPVQTEVGFPTQAQSVGGLLVPAERQQHHGDGRLKSGKLHAHQDLGRLPEEHRLVRQVENSGHRGIQEEGHSRRLLPHLPEAHQSDAQKIPPTQIQSH